MLGLAFAVLLSGAASLVYQVSWTRRLADVTSATVHAQAIVLAVFFAGLGLGAVYPGRLAAKARRPLAGYAALEIGALAAALASIPVFTALESVRAALSRAGLAPGTGLAVELALAGAMLLVPSVLMGASLPFALEHAERSLGAAARRRFVPIVYGVNTVGAALGCALAGFVLVERIGLARTTAAGAATAFAAACVGLALSRRASVGRDDERDERDERDETPDVLGDQSQPACPRAGVLAAAALAGAIGVGAEVVWTRLFSLIVLNTVYAFTQVLVAVLVGIGAGAVLARVIAGRTERVGILRAAGVAQAGAAIAMACVGPLSLLLAGRSELEGAIAAGRSPLGALCLVLAVAVPIALNAATLPLLVQAVATARVSTSFGTVYAANTAGGVVGSLACGFVLVPGLGITGASATLEVASLVLAAGLLWMGSPAKRDALAAVLPGLVVVALHAQFRDVAREICEARVPPGTRILELREGVTSSVMVTEAESGQRRLWINSSWVAGTGGGHKALGHLPALFVPSPRRAVGIALGTGQTFAAVVANGATELHVVELNPDVIALSRRWFADANERLFERPGVTVHVQDGRAFLRSRRDQFDLVVLEPLQAWSRGTSSLYSREFYEEARAVLAPSGVVAQWIPFYGQSFEDTRAMVRTALEVFPAASLWLDERDGILLLHGGAVALPPAEMEARIADRRVGPDLRSKSIESSADVMSLLVLGPSGLARWTKGALVLTDDRPVLEFRAARDLGQPSADPIVASIDRARDPAGPEAAAIAGGSGPAALEADAASRALIADTFGPERELPARATVLEAAMRAAPHVSLLRRRYRTVIDSWALEERERGDARVEAILRRAVAHDDDYGEAMLNLAILAIRARSTDHARGHLERAKRIERTRARAEQLLRELP